MKMSINQFKEKIFSLIEKDDIHFGRKKPKYEVLFLLKNEIKIALLKLYSVSEIISLLSNIDKTFSVSDTTLYAFLKKELPRTYYMNIKMRYLSYKANKIAQLLADGIEDYSIIYEKIGIEKSVKINKNISISIQFEEFEFFMNEYFNKSYKDLDVAQIETNYDFVDEERNQNIYTTDIADKMDDYDLIDEKKIQNISIDENHRCEMNSGEKKIIDGKLYQIFPAEDKDLDFKAIPVLNFEKNPNKISEKVRKQTEVPLEKLPYFKEYGGYLKYPIFKNSFPLKKWEEIREEQNKYRAKPLPMFLEDNGIHLIDEVYRDADDFDWSKIKPQMIIHENPNDYMDLPLYKYRNTCHLDIDRAEELILERFYFLDWICSLDLIDLRTYPFVEGQAFICRTTGLKANRFGDYDVYRYYKGELYYVYTHNDDMSPAFLDQMRHTGMSFISLNLQNLMRKYERYKNQGLIT